MNRHAFPAGGFLAMAMLLAPSSAAAQAPPQAPPNVAAPHPSPDPKATAASAPVTLTGCLERSKPSSATGGQGTPATAPMNASPAFVLRTNATTPSSGGKGVVYNIVSLAPSVRLDAHVGHTVEVTGTLRLATNQQPGMSNEGVSASTPSGSTGMETLPTSEPTAAGPGATPSVTQPLFVESLKMIDGTCKAPTE